jgi:hypothetical protein
MNRWLLLPAVLLALPLPGGVQAQGDKTQALKAGDLTLNVPADWEVAPEDTTLLSVLTPVEGADDTFRENLRITAEDVNAGVGIEALFTQAQQAIGKADHPLKLVSKGAVTANGHRVLWMALRPKKPQPGQAGLTLLEYGFVHGGKAYSFKAMAADAKADKFRASVEKILKTVEPKAGK